MATRTTVPELFFNTIFGAEMSRPPPSKTSQFYARIAPLENLAYHSETVLLCKHALMVHHLHRKVVPVIVACSTQFKLVLQAE